MKKGIISVLSAALGAAAGAGSTSYYKDKKIEEKNEKVLKFKGYYNMLIQWLKLKQEGKGLESFFKKNGYKKIAVYGMGEMGNLLCSELIGTDTEILYVVDRNDKQIYTNIRLISNEDDFEPVDAMIVTATFAFDEIRDEIEEKCDFPIISLEDVVFEC